MIKKFNYIVAIRTLGTAGKDFEREILSLNSQSILPEEILVYIAEGFARPKQIANEKYIYVKKGMVAQRALSYNEINTDFILLLDDDVYLPPNCVEILASEMERLKGDCIAADVFMPQESSLVSKLYNFFVNLSFPHRDDKWAFKVMSNVSFTYNSNPHYGVYLSQSAAGPISLWRKEVIQGINYHDEIWLDQMGFAFGDDQLMFQKVYKNGYRLLVSYDSGAVHLNAKSSSSLYQQSSDKYYKRAKALYMIWFRSCFQLSNMSKMGRFRVGLSYFFKQIYLLFVHIACGVLSRDVKVLSAFIRGNVDGYKDSKKILKHLPNFIQR